MEPEFIQERFSYWAFDNIAWAEFCVWIEEEEKQKNKHKNQSCTVVTGHQGFAQQRLQILQLWRELESVNHGGFFFFFLHVPVPSKPHICAR